MISSNSITILVLSCACGSVATINCSLQPEGLFSPRDDDVENAMDSR